MTLILWCVHIFVLARMHSAISSKVASIVLRLSRFSSSWRQSAFESLSCVITSHMCKLTHTIGAHSKWIATTLVFNCKIALVSFNSSCSRDCALTSTRHETCYNREAHIGYKCISCCVTTYCNNKNNCGVASHHPN